MAKGDRGIIIYHSLLFSKSKLVLISIYTEEEKELRTYESS